MAPAGRLRKMDRALNLFLRYPERGKVKTRIAAHLGDDFAHKLYLSFLRDLFASAGKVNAHVIVTYASEGDVDEAAAASEWGYEAHRQSGKNLGERMFNSMKRIFRMGYERCVLMGSDIPDLPAETLAESFIALDTHDYVLGPSEDGGYYLVGTKKEKLHESVFQGIPWSTGGVLKATMRAMDAGGLGCRILGPWSDIDDMEDLRAFYTRNLQGTASTFTMQFLMKSGIFTLP